MKVSTSLRLALSQHSIAGRVDTENQPEETADKKPPRLKAVPHKAQDGLIYDASASDNTARLHDTADSPVVSASQSKDMELSIREEPEPPKKLGDVSSTYTTNWIYNSTSATDTTEEDENIRSIEAAIADNPPCMGSWFWTTGATSLTWLVEHILTLIYITGFRCILVVSQTSTAPAVYLPDITRFYSAEPTYSREEAKRACTKLAVEEDVMEFIMSTPPATCSSHQGGRGDTNPLSRNGCADSGFATTLQEFYASLPHPLPPPFDTCTELPTTPHPHPTTWFNQSLTNLKGCRLNHEFIDVKDPTTYRTCSSGQTLTSLTLTVLQVAEPFFAYGAVHLNPRLFLPSLYPISYLQSSPSTSFQDLLSYISLSLAGFPHGLKR
jgi:hypothetical protein